MNKALIVAGGWEGHEPQKCADLFAGLLREKGYEVEVSDTLDSYLDVEKLNALSLIVPIWTMGKISEEQGKGLIEAVKGGVGFAGFHGGMGDSFRGYSSYEWLVGGHFVSHPGDIKDYTVNIKESNDPITQGVGDFKMHSEQYYMLTDPGNRVLATTTFDGEGYGMTWLKGVEMPVVWTRQWGEGRVFYNSLGHVAADFEVHEARELTLRGMLWASK
jgi:type 1 glutamine amidotransferase